MPLRERPPAIRVPLREKAADVALDLRSLQERCCDNGGYRDDLDPEAEPDPSLEPGDDAWADTLLREKGHGRRPGARRPGGWRGKKP